MILNTPIQGSVVPKEINKGDSLSWQNLESVEELVSWYDEALIRCSPPLNDQLYPRIHALLVIL